MMDELDSPARVAYCANQLARYAWCLTAIMSDDDAAIQLEDGKWICSTCVEKLLSVHSDTLRPLKPLPANFRRKVADKTERNWTL